MEDMYMSLKACVGFYSMGVSVFGMYLTWSIAKPSLQAGEVAIDSERSRTLLCQNFCWGGLTGYRNKDGFREVL